MSGGGDGDVVKYDLGKLLEWDEETMWNFVNSIGGSDWPPPPPSLEESGEKTCQRKSTTMVEVVAVGGDDDFHIVTERMRRKKMRCMFSGLHQLLPHVPPKADKSTIVEEAVNEIRKLEVKVQELEKLRQDRLRTPAYAYSTTTSPAASDNVMVSGLSSVGSTTMATPTGAAGAGAGACMIVPDPMAPQFSTWSHPNVVLNICGEEAMFNICAVKKPGLLTAICGILERYKIDVVATYVSSDLPNQSKFMLHCRANTAACASSRFTIEAFPAEERYYQTAKEMLLLLAPCP